MKKLLKGLLILTLVVSSVRAATNKTFFAPRPHGVNMAMEYTAWNEMIHMDLEGTDRHGGYFAITPFYQDSTDGDDDLGRYFGVRNKYDLSLHTVTYANQDVALSHILHDATAGAAADQEALRLRFDPDHTAFGVRFDFYKDLSDIIKGLYIKMNTGIVNVDNDLNMVISNGTGGYAAAANTSLTNFFRGTATARAAGNGLLSGGNNVSAQKALTAAKIYGGHDTTDFMDIDVMLGWRFLDKKNYYLAINLGTTIPTSHVPSGTWLFEPVAGNGNHWAFGAGFDFGWTMWEDDKQNLKLATALNYRFLIEGTERRTLGLKDHSGTPIRWGQYYAIAEIGMDFRYLRFTPAANVLTQYLNVEPGSQIDAILQLSYNNGGLTIDLGYNFFWKDNENVDLKYDWEDNRWGTPYVGQVLTGFNNVEHYYANGAAALAVGAAESANGGSEYYINKTAAAKDANDLNGAYAIDVRAAETPSQITHKIYGGLGYIFREWDWPVMLNLAGHYEFVSDDGIENWGIWGKVAIGF